MTLLSFLKKQPFKNVKIFSEFITLKQTKAFMWPHWPVCWLLDYKKAQFRTFENAHNEYCLIAGKENEGCAIPRDCGSQNKMAQAAASRQFGWGTAVKQPGKTTTAHNCLPIWDLIAPELRVSVSRWEHCLNKDIEYYFQLQVASRKSRKHTTQKTGYQYILLSITLYQFRILWKRQEAQAAKLCLPLGLNELSHRECRPDDKKSHAKNELTISNPARYLRNANERGDKNLHPRKKNP